MQDPIEPDRLEILSGPGDARLAARDTTPAGKPPKNTRKTAVIAASALVAVLVAGGAGYLLAGSQGGTAQPGAVRPAPSQSVGGNEDLGGDDTTTGDAATDAPDDDLSTDAPDDGSMGDAATDVGSGGDPATDTGTNPSRGTAETGDGKTPATTSPTKAPQPSEADNPADGPAGELSGQCAKSGC
ncbi:hypothetical protein [Nonomuraea sp. NPDC049400]|uniref:hypothetical protein n=1 Tax=Nonomuraea sp. NPDC049400 TaxID=3364352 RepID=UPI00379D9284